jgi:amino acid transporter
VKCYRHPEQDAHGICAACGKGLCAEACAHDGASGLHCDAACAERLRRREPRGDAPVGWIGSALLIIIGSVLLYYGYRYSEWTMSVPNLLGMLFLWYGVVLLLQRMAGRSSKSQSMPPTTP